VISAWGDAADIEVALDDLFGGAPDDLYAYAWTPRDHASHWFRVGERQAIVEPLSQLSARDDVYIAGGLAWEPRGRFRRLHADEVDAIVGFCADIDVAGPMHDKIGLPPTFEAAHEIIATCGMPATRVVHTGHGIQAWWLFAEAWVFDQPGERALAQQRALGWQRHLSDVARQRGYTIDSVHDLCRVMRLPGTLNWKGVR
jgi:putative DNA primase/helicase